MPIRLMAISDRRQLTGASLYDWLEWVAAAGVDAVQLREKDLGARELLALAERARELLAGRARLLVNGRADVALAAGADGVHLTSTGLPVAAVRRWLSGRAGRRLLVGRSTHSPAEVAEAAAGGADYVTFGPVYATPSKAAYGPPPGLAGLRRAAAHGLPVLALGGVTIERLEALASAGARGAAGIRLFLEPGRLPRVVAQARRVFPDPPPADLSPASPPPA